MCFHEEINADFDSVYFGLVYLDASGKSYRFEFITPVHGHVFDKIDYKTSYQL